MLTNIHPSSTFGQTRCVRSCHATCLDLMAMAQNTPSPTHRHLGGIKKSASSTRHELQAEEEEEKDEAGMIPTQNGRNVHTQPGRTHKVRVLCDRPGEWTSGVKILG